MATHPAETAHALLAAWNARDFDRFVSMLAPDIEWYDLGMPHPPAHGRQAVRDFSHSVLAAFPDFEYVIEHPLCVDPDRNRCVALWRISATHTGVLSPPDFSPTGRRATLRGVDVFEFRGEEVCRILSLFDPIIAAEQLTGMALRPPPGSLRERLAVSLQRIVAFFARRRVRTAAKKRVAADSLRSPVNPDVRQTGHRLEPDPWGTRLAGRRRPRAVVFVP